MGSGKSVIGKELSKLYNIDFLDSDQIIEERTGKKISFIFKNYGEIYFREIEEKICLKILEKENCVIALGGGSIISPKVRELMYKNSFSIYLKVDIKTLIDRIKNNRKRPLLNNVDKNKVLETLYHQRKKFYSEANLIIENNFEKQVILHKIYSAIEKL
tara:strand:- start:7 stop:483 length:477 start_codon:yes stop_codon:yes gene_type:complete